MRFSNRILRFIGATAIAVAVSSFAWTASPALALDRITLKEGNQVIEGEIIREVNGYIFIKFKVNGVEQTKAYAPDQIAKIERDIKPDGAAPAPKGDAPKDAAPKGEPDKAPADQPAPAKDEAKGEEAPAKPGVPRAAIITMGDRINGEMVGMYMTAHTLRTAIPDLEKDLGTDRSGVVVLRVYSGGGALLEIEKLWGAIRGEYMKRWRTVGWIESAISAAAMTSHCMEEIYFTSQANYGACSGYSGALVAMKGAELERVLIDMENISRLAGHDPLIMRAMQIPQPLSATVDPDGKVHFYPDTTSGKILVNRDKEILTLNAATAREIKFSMGTADTLEELTKAMGYNELQWMGETVKGVAWPVTKGERKQMEFRKKTKHDEERLNYYWRNYQVTINAAQGARDRQERAKIVGKARQHWNDIKEAVKNNPNHALFTFNMFPEEWRNFVEEQEKLMRDLMK